MYIQWRYTIHSPLQLQQNALAREFTSLAYFFSFTDEYLEEIPDIFLPPSLPHPTPPPPLLKKCFSPFPFPYHSLHLFRLNYLQIILYVENYLQILLSCTSIAGKVHGNQRIADSFNVFRAHLARICAAY